MSMLVIPIRSRNLLTDTSPLVSALSPPVHFLTSVGVGQVIAGWDKGLQEMCEGEKRKLQIPPQDGYGDRGAGSSIPGGATLVFDGESSEVKNDKGILD